MRSLDVLFNTGIITHCNGAAAPYIIYKNLGFNHFAIEYQPGHYYIFTENHFFYKKMFENYSVSPNNIEGFLKNQYVFGVKHYLDPSIIKLHHYPLFDRYIDKMQLEALLVKFEKYSVDPLGDFVKCFEQKRRSIRAAMAHSSPQVKQMIEILKSAK